MCSALTLPPDLDADEAARVEAMRAHAVAEAERDAALLIRVRRTFSRLTDPLGRHAMGKEAALDMIAGDRDLPVSRGRAEQMVRGYGKWAV